MAIMESTHVKNNNTLLFADNIALLSTSTEELDTTMKKCTTTAEM